MTHKIHIMLVFFCFLGVSFFPGVCLHTNVSAQTLNSKNTSGAETTQTIPESVFRQKFVNYLIKHLKKEPSDIIVSKFKVMRNLPVPAGTVNIRLFQKGSKELAEYVSLKAVVKVNRKVENKVQLRAWVDVFEKVVCTSRYLKRNHIIQKQDLYLKRKNISHLSNDVTGDLKSVVGLMVKHNIRADRCIKSWMVEKPYVVKRGDMVRILAESGVLRVTAPGRTLDRGYKGQVIMVQNRMSQKRIYAKVINSSLVKVEF